MLTDTDSLKHKTETENFYEDSTKIKCYLTSLIAQKIQNSTIMQIT